MTTASTFRLFGAGRHTAGLAHDLEPGVAVVIGRHTECTIALPANGEESAGSTISRRHVVFEFLQGRGWCVYDSGSENGTAVLTGGLPPAVRLEPGVACTLHPGDVVELAGNSDFRFRFERT